MKHLLAKILVLTIVFTGVRCSGSDESAQPDVTTPSPACLIQKYIRKLDVISSAPYEDTVTYTYDAYGRINKLRVYATWGVSRKDETYTFRYFKDRLPSAIESNKASYKFIYDEQDRLQAWEFYRNGALNTRDEYTYDVSGKIEQIIRKAGATVIDRKFSFDYAGTANPSIVTDSLCSDGKTRYSFNRKLRYTVDGKVFAGFDPDFLIDFSFYKNNITGFTGNITRVEYLDATNTVGDFVNLVSISKQYNDKGFPLTFTGTRREYGTPGLKEYREFVYTCQ